MDRQIVAIMIQEGGKLLSEVLRNRPRKYVEEEATVEQASEQTLTEAIEENTQTQGKASEIATGCVPCAVGHFSTCSGLLNEAMRFAKSDGIESSEVIDRVNMCLDELNSMERVDLRPEMIAELPKWEKDLANRALAESRATRHALESISDVETLEKVAANTQSARQEVGRAWFKERIKRMPKEEKARLAEKAMEKLEKEVQNDTG